MSTLWPAASCVLSVALGGALVYLFLGSPGKRWSHVLLHLSLAIGFGMGVSSLVYFWVRLAAGPSTVAPLAVEIALAAGLAALAWKRGAPPSQDTLRLRFAGVWILGPMVAICAVVAGARFVESTQASPHGGWDAWGIWNVRAKFLAENSPAWTRGFRPSAQASARFGGAMHPEYPPLLPAYVGRSWNYAGTQSTDAPALAAGALSFAVAGLLTAGLAALRGATAGLLGAMIFFGSATVLNIGVLQYADVPLAFFLLAAIVTAMLATRYGDRALALSGLAAGLGAWTKNEGLVMAIGLGAAVAILMRKRALLWLAGAAPGLAAAACYKLFLTPPDPMLHGQSFAAKLADPARYAIILRGFWEQFAAMGDGLAHPALALALLAAGLGFALDAKLRPAWIAGLVAILAALGSYFAAYLFSPFDLQWHVSTSVDRLIVQLWPAVILVVIAILWQPGEAVVQAEATPALKHGRKARKQMRPR